LVFCPSVEAVREKSVGRILVDDQKLYKEMPLLNSQWVDWRVKYGRQPGEANT
jgi:hypothetical protein